MTQREKILAAAVLVVLVVLGGNALWGRYRDLVAERHRDLQAARERLDEAKLAVERGQQAIERMEAWQQQSLPADREAARSLYRAWLLEQFEQAGLSVDDAQPNQRTLANAGQTTIGYTIAARGTLEETIRLLDRFYRSPMLHQITRLQLRPSGNSSQLSVTLTVEALILPGATHEDQLPTGESNRLAEANVDEFVERIEGRNLLAVYRPPRPDPPPTVQRERPPRPVFDHAKFARFTATVGPSNALQAWVTVLTTGEVLRLSAGDPIKVGEFEGQVLAIEPRALTVESGEKQLRIELGTSLRDGKELNVDQAVGDPQADSKET